MPVRNIAFVFLIAHLAHRRRNCALRHYYPVNRRVLCRHSQNIKAFARPSYCFRVAGNKTGNRIVRCTERNLADIADILMVVLQNGVKCILYICFQSANTDNVLFSGFCHRNRALLLELRNRSRFQKLVLCRCVDFLIAEPPVNRAGLICRKHHFRCILCKFVRFGIAGKNPRFI